MVAGGCKSALASRELPMSDGQFQQYFDPQGRRLFRYDDAPHHPDVATHPHHLHRGPEPPEHERDRVYPLDICRVNFVAVLAKIEQQYLGPYFVSW
jgi:hypothetical protein